MSTKHFEVLPNNHSMKKLLQGVKNMLNWMFEQTKNYSTIVENKLENIPTSIHNNIKNILKRKENFNLS